jgi:hypothetical protein
MDYYYGITTTVYKGVRTKSVRFSKKVPPQNIYKISSILSMVNMDYVSYYIKELKGLEKQPESRKRQIIENDNETRRRIYIEGDKAYTETYEGEREEEVGIGELVEYLSVIKKELGLSDEMLVDEEFDDVY